MSQSIDTSGPAFPMCMPTSIGTGVVYGMTLHDYFAAHANPALYKPLETLTAKLGRHPSVGELADYIANLRFIEAGAMLKEKNK